MHAVRQGRLRYAVVPARQHEIDRVFGRERFPSRKECREIFVRPAISGIHEIRPRA